MARFAHGPAKPGHAPVIDNITKKGRIIYRAGSSAVRDDGERITVSGSVEFKAVVIRAAVDARLPITFADPAGKPAAGRGHQGPG